MTQLGEGIAVTSITDPDRPHWVQVEYKYANGKPVKGSFLATDSEGMTWAGKLNDQGQACLSNLPPGSVEFELVSDDIEDELKQTRANIKAVLDAIVAEQKAEAAKHEKELAQQNALQQAGSHYWAYTKGFWNGAVGLVTFAKDVVVKTAEVAQYLNPLERLNNLLHAGYKSYYDGTLTSAQWKQSLAKNLRDEEIKDIARILGIDAKHLSSEGLQRLKELFAEAYEITAFIADDKESLDMLTQFGKDYAGAQSSIEWAEFAGGGVFEIVLTALLLMFTGGVGNVAQGASKIRHAGKLKSLGSIFRSLGKLLKRKKLRKKVRVNVDTKKPVKTELPEDKKLTPKKKPTYQHGQSDGGPGTWQKETTPQKGSEYQTQVTGAPKDTEYVVKTDRMTSGKKKFDGYDPETNTLIDAKDWEPGPKGWPPEGQDWASKNVAKIAEKDAAIAKDVGSKLEYHVPTQEKANQLKEIFKSEGIKGVKVVVTPKG
ncbi:Tox-REase-5 domain-containing protein [Cellvibrio mixtus]|uniref:Tox-REase-5 domain-containing protein n=1 Tax=Cellvibrio mixtus TaxID=39650 RepID=UPI001481F6AE|nr:Tox-REase-5 domain-containing protein [Cellvibrio mixtus]